MEEIRRIINKEEYCNFQELMKNFYDITIEQTKQTKELMKFISLFDDFNQSKKAKSTIIDNNVMIPYVDTFIKEINKDNKKVEINDVKGLID